MADPLYVTRAPIELAELLAGVGDPAAGGTVVFFGTVRRSDADGPVAAIDYSAYEEMVAEEFGRIVQETVHRWPGVRVAARHRVGWVPVGEASFAVATAAAHREEAFAACRFVVEAAKQRLPVWKKEVLDDGTARWREDPAGDALPRP